MTREEKEESGCNPRMEDIEYLVKELQLHQIELETQNEELKRANLETEAALKKYSTLYNSAPIGYFTLNQRGRISKVNAAGAILLGMDEASLLNKQIQYFIDRHSLDHFNELLSKICQTNQKQKSRIMLQNQQGIPIETYIEGVAIKLGIGPESQMLLAVTDISDLKRMEEELREAHIADKLKTEFFSNVSHEFRTPLNVIFATLQLIDLYKQDEDHTIDMVTLYRFMEMIKQNCRRLLRLVGNLIDVTRIDAGFFEPVFENQEITKNIKEITLSVNQFVESKGLTLSLEQDIGQLFLACDLELIERVMLNLLSNAVKYTKPGGKIVVRLYHQKDTFYISTKDTGIGIPKDKIEQIFQRFRQVDRTMTRENEGSGIGLNLVQAIIQMHKGSITVLSEYGEGSEFIIGLPVRLLPEHERTEQKKFIQKEGNMIERVKIEFSDIYL